MLKAAGVAKRLEHEEGYAREVGEIDREEEWREEEKERRRVEECESGRRLLEDVAENSSVGEEEESVAIGPLTSLLSVQREYEDQQFQIKLTHLPACLLSRFQHIWDHKHYKNLLLRTLISFPNRKGQTNINLN